MIRRALILLAVVALVAVVSAGVVAWSALDAVYGEFSQPAIVDYQPGQSSDELADTLESAGVVRSRWLFLLARALRRDEVLQAGEYEFSEPRSVLEVMDVIADGRVRLYPLTIPEGLTRFDTAALVAQAGYAEEQEFLAMTADPTPVLDLFPEAQSLEGCLFPETYMLPRGTDGRHVLNAMVERFRLVFAEAFQGRESVLEAYPLLVMASMIEKETGVDDERARVSSVYQNRLRIGMPMQCDPTVIYGLLLQNRYRGRLLLKDLEDPHPYNTYVRRGLPPGPIANPGAASIHAAAHPAKTNYLYFVARSVGRPEHAFSKSLAEHNRAVAAYRKTQGR